MAGSRFPSSILGAVFYSKNEYMKGYGDYMKNTIKLQGISGQQQGTQAKDLQIGDIIIWNYGDKSEVVDIQPSKTGKTIVFQIKSLQDGEIRERKMTASRMIVVDAPKYSNPVEKAIAERKCTYNSIYSDIGNALESFTTSELAEYYTKICGSDSSLRYFIEQGIIANEINKEKVRA